MTRPVGSVANGDVCPLDPVHERMFMLATGRQFCAHSAHSAAGESAVFLNDGVTPLGRPSAPRRPGVAPDATPARVMAPGASVAGNFHVGVA